MDLIGIKMSIVVTYWQNPPMAGIFLIKVKLLTA